MKRIIIGYGVSKKIMEDIGVTAPTIISALKFKTRTNKAKKIRQRAFQLGGIVMEKVDNSNQ